MTKNTHLLGGAVATIALGCSVPGVIAGLFGSLLPDIDHEEAALGRKVRFISKRLTHRGGTHSLLFALITSLIVAIFSKEIAFGLFLGILSHLILDMFNKTGIPIFMGLSDMLEYIKKDKTKNKQRSYYKVVKDGILTRSSGEFWFKILLVCILCIIFTSKIMNSALPINSFLLDGNLYVLLFIIIFIKNTHVIDKNSK